MQSHNQTLFGIHSDTERYFLAIWLLFVILSSVIGDSVILLATTKYKVLNLFKVIVAIMQHMAICNLLQSMFCVFPAFTAVIEDKWILGRVLCHFNDTFRVMCNLFTTISTCALSTVKLLHLKYPLIARTWSKNTGHKICIALWVCCVSIYGPLLVEKTFYMRNNISFNYANYGCNYLHHSTKTPSWYKKYAPIGMSAFHILCYTTLVVTSTLILLIAQKVRSRRGGEVRLEGTVTVLLTVAIQLLTYLPSLVLSWRVIEYNGQVWRTAKALLYVNIIANFYIYCITARSFREFLKSKILKFLYFLRQSILKKVIHPQI